MKRRSFLAAPLIPLAARAEPAWHNVDIAGASPALAFAMPATPDGRVQTEADYRGFITMLYFGYTFCPDLCPLTGQNIAAALAKAGNAASRIRFLFVTVDPRRDTIPVLTEYMRALSPNFTGLRGDADQLTRLGIRYRIAWSVNASPDPAKYEVSHTTSIWVFDQAGNARLLVPEMGTANPDIDGFAADLKRLADEPPSWKDWLRRLA